MPEILIPNLGNISYFTKSEIPSLTYESDYKMICQLFDMTEHISKFLNVPCPYISLASFITLRNDKDGSLHDMAAMTFHPEDVPGLDNTILQFSLKLLNGAYTTGVIAHELRHIYQKKYAPEIIKEYAQGFKESLTNPAEIDADAFAIWYLSTKPKMSLEKAASIMCPSEKKHVPEAYFLRIEKAKNIALEMEKGDNNFSNTFSLFNKVIKFFVK